jgi:hypothetical protein
LMAPATKAAANATAACGKSNGVLKLSGYRASRLPFGARNRPNARRNSHFRALLWFFAHFAA